MSKKKPNAHIGPKIISLWSGGNQNNQLSYKEIVATLKTDGVSERTVSRHLSNLVNDKILDKEERGKKTFYRPTSDNAFKQNQISEESLSRVGSYVIRVLDEIIRETKGTTNKIEDLVWSQIDDTMSEAERQGRKDTTETFEQAMNNVLSKIKLSNDEKQQLHEKLDSLLGDLANSLTRPEVFARLEKADDLRYTLLEQDIWNLVKNFMDVWTFLYKHPWALSECRRYLQTITK